MFRFTIIAISYDPATCKHTLQLKLLNTAPGVTSLKTVSGSDFMDAIRHTGVTYEQLSTRMLFQSDDFENLVNVQCLGVPDKD
jgi:hypothetical protein